MFDSWQSHDTLQFRFESRLKYNSLENDETTWKKAMNEMLHAFTIDSIHNLLLISITIIMMKTNFVLNTWSNECNKITKYLVPVSDKDTFVINYSDNFVWNHNILWIKKIDWKDFYPKDTCRWTSWASFACWSVAVIYTDFIVVLMPQQTKSYWIPFNTHSTTSHYSGSANPTILLFHRPNI